MKILTNRISQMTDEILGLEGKIDELEYSDNNRDEIVRKHKKNLRHLWDIPPSAYYSTPPLLTFPDLLFPSFFDIPLYYIFLEWVPPPWPLINFLIS